MSRPSNFQLPWGPKGCEMRLPAFFSTKNHEKIEKPIFLFYFYFVLGCPNDSKTHQNLLKIFCSSPTNRRSASEQPISQPSRYQSTRFSENYKKCQKIWNFDIFRNFLKIWCSDICGVGEWAYHSGFRRRLHTLHTAGRRDVG